MAKWDVLELPKWDRENVLKLSAAQLFKCPDKLDGNLCYCTGRDDENVSFFPIDERLLKELE